MKTIMNRSKMINKLTGAILLLSMSFGIINGQLSSDKSIWKDIVTLDKLIKDINLETSKAPYLFYQNNTNLNMPFEDVIKVELWMVDLNCWKNNKLNNLNDLLCIEEYELDYLVENWMLSEFINPSNDLDEISPDETITVENWMINPDHWKSNDEL